jgi:hypothetical protein
MNAGKNAFDQGNASNALAQYSQAALLAPGHVDVHLNLAISQLLANNPTNALRDTDTALRLDPNSAAAHFIRACALLRLANPQEAVKALDNVRRIDPGETAAYFQLGRAHMELGRWEDAARAFREGLALEPNRLHTAAHYLLGQALIRLGRTDEAREHLDRHLAGMEAQAFTPDTTPFERSKLTQPRVPFRLDQPEPQGIPVRFIDQTETVLGSTNPPFSGPFAILDPDQDGWHDVVALEPGLGLRFLRNQAGTLAPHLPPTPLPPNTSCHAILAGDLNNDRLDEILVLASPGSLVLSLGPDGTLTNVTASSGLETIPLADGALADLDFTGHLDLLAITLPGRTLRVLRQSAPLRFSDATPASGIPASWRNVQSVTLDDWNRDGTSDLVAHRAAERAVLMEKPRGGPLRERTPQHWTAGHATCTGDFDNDLRPDLAILARDRIVLCLENGVTREIPCPDASTLRGLSAFDHDNDGWLDLWAHGDRLRAWRNLGSAGFREQTADLGLDQLTLPGVQAIAWADFDRDCDPDLLIALAGGGLRFLQNEGANAHGMIRVHLAGNRSNASGLGCKVEIETGGLRLLRTVHRLPVEIGVGRHTQLDSFLVHWFNWPQGSAELPVDCQEPILAQEATIQEGSCPYLYAWDGSGFRFVTDILGAAPLGLPAAPGHIIEADPEEWVWLGDSSQVKPRDNRYLVEITEELREVLYLDHARLAVVDRHPSTEVHPTDKLLPRGPFPPGELATLHREHPLRHAQTLTGTDVTEQLRAVDGLRVSPPRLRTPQLRGLAEPHGWILDFGPVKPGPAPTLVLNGWLRFGGGMANIAAALNPSLPFPFPSLEAEISPGHWQPVDVAVGAPAGKTKTILVDLAGLWPHGTGRLRLTQAFEIHWDRIALLEKHPEPPTRITLLNPARADLRFRGFSRLLPLPPDAPPSPDYPDADPNSPWTVIPEGWATRYGEVTELVSARDEGLAIVHSGDALRIEFDASSLPPVPQGHVREFFLHVDGWDKDSDFHVVTGTRLEPLPFHGMDAQRYGSQPRPPFPSDALHRTYNTRWVDGRALRQISRR